jgi:Sucrase/ferredoxin-like
VTFESHEDLRGLDLATAGEPTDQLFLVCTHGKHDPCCARYGRPLFEALAEQVEEEAVWQVTHIGGDRFAGNLVCLPEGIYYGRVEREQTGDVLDNHLAGQIELPHYRGRSCWSFAAQAAERDIREHAQLFGIGDLRLVEEDGERIVFEDATGRRHERRARVELGPEDYLTCNSTDTRRPRRFAVSR